MSISKPQPALVRGGDQVVGILQRAEARVDVGVVGDVIAPVGERRGVDGRQPDGIGAQIGDVVQALRDALQVPLPVAVGVLKGARIDLVDDRVAPPRRRGVGAHGHILPVSAGIWPPCRRRGGTSRHPGQLRASDPGVACRRLEHLSSADCRWRFAGKTRSTSSQTRRLSLMVADAGPPIALIAVGLVLWLAVNATLAGISIQTVGLILFLAGVVWLVFEMIQARSVTRRGVVDEPVAYRRRGL
jgi:hypothetical protein